MEGPHVQRVHLNQGCPARPPCHPWACGWRRADAVPASAWRRLPVGPPAARRGPSGRSGCAPPSRSRYSSPCGGVAPPACPCPTGGTARGAPSPRAPVPAAQVGRCTRWGPPAPALQTLDALGIVAALPAEEGPAADAEVPAGQRRVPSVGGVVVHPGQPDLGLPAQRPSGLGQSACMGHVPVHDVQSPDPSPKSRLCIRTRTEGPVLL